MDDRPDDRGERSSGWASGMGTLAEYSVIGFVFPLALAIGFFFGRWIGTMLGGPMLGAVIGVLLGTAAGFYNLWETMQRIEQRERRLRQGEKGAESEGPDAGGGEEER